jgi:hypothetical protein
VADNAFPNLFTGIIGVLLHARSNAILMMWKKTALNPMTTMEFSSAVVFLMETSLRKQLSSFYNDADIVLFGGADITDRFGDSRYDVARLHQRAKQEGPC